MMGQTLLVVLLFVGVLSMLPFAVKWIQRRAQGGTAASLNASRLVSVLAVGPQQRVVTVEVGPEGARTWLVLGVTGQAITCLHSASVAVPPTGYPAVASAAQSGVLHGQG